MTKTAMKDFRTEAQYRAALATCWQMIEQGKEYQEKQRVELAALREALYDLVYQVDRPSAPEWLDLDQAKAALAAAPKPGE